MAKDITSDISKVPLNGDVEIDWDSTDNAERKFDLTFSDEKCVILLRHDDTSTENEDCTVTIKSGGMWQKGYGDLTFTLEKDDYHAVIFDSAVVKNSDGEVEIDLKNEAGAAYGAGGEAASDIAIAVLQLDYSIDRS